MVYSLENEIGLIRIDHDNYFILCNFHNRHYRKKEKGRRN